MSKNPLPFEPRPSYTAEQTAAKVGYWLIAQVLGLVLLLIFVGAIAAIAYYVFS